MFLLKIYNGNLLIKVFHQLYTFFCLQAKEAIIDKSNSLEEESFKCRRMYEENGGLKRKIEKAKKMEYLGASDEILVEEVKMYKVSD